MNPTSIHRAMVVLMKNWENAKKQKAYWKEQLKNVGNSSTKWRMVFTHMVYWSNEEYFWRPNRWFDVYGINGI